MTCTTISPPRGHPIHDLGQKLSDRIRQMHRRRGLRRLLDKDDEILDDIGVTRGEIQIATDLPLSVDAASALYRMSLERRRRHM